MNDMFSVVKHSEREGISEDQHKELSELFFLFLHNCFENPNPCYETIQFQKMSECIAYSEFNKSIEKFY